MFVQTYRIPLNNKYCNQTIVTAETCSSVFMGLLDQGYSTLMKLISKLRSPGGILPRERQQLLLLQDTAHRAPGRFAVA
jgi:hypothetical protein